MSVRSYNNDKNFEQQQQQDTSDLYEVAKNHLSPKKNTRSLDPTMFATVRSALKSNHKFVKLPTGEQETC